MRKVDYSGKKFGKITVIKEIGFVYHGDRKRGVWLCQCDCGKYINLPSCEISKGKQKSCGCDRKGKICRNGGKRKLCTYELLDDCVRGFDSNNSEFLIDSDDYERFKEYCWFVSANGGVQTTINKKTVELHRFIMNMGDSELVVDHINHDRTDNRKVNLRIATVQENSMNRVTPVNNKLGRIGISYIEKLGKYRARIKINGKQINGGLFDKLQDAIESRENLEKQYFGEFRNKDL